MSRSIPFEVQPTEPQRILVTLADGRKVEVLLRFAVVDVTDHEFDALVAGRSVPSINVNFQPIIGVRVLDGDAPASPLPPGVSSVSTKPN